MKPDESTASAAGSTSTSSAITPTRALTAPPQWRSLSPLHQTQRRQLRRSLFTSPPPRIQEPIPGFSTSRGPRRELFKPVVDYGRGFIPMARPPFDIQEHIPGFPMPQRDPLRELFEPRVYSGRGFIPIDNPPFRIREPIPEFSMPRLDPSRTFFNPFVFSGRGFMDISPPAHRIREPIPGFSMPPQTPPQNISYPFVSSGRGFMRKHTGSVSTYQTVTGANLGQQAAETTVPPSSSAECSDSREARERTNVETFAVVRDRKVRITEGASLYQLCRSWFRNGLPEKDYQLPHETTYQMTLPKPLPPATAGAARLEKKEDNEEETENKNKEKEELVDNLTPEDLLKQHITRGKRVRSRFREEHQEQISRYKHRLSLLFPKPAEQADSNTSSEN